jgi:hypothetical protein
MPDVDPDAAAAAKKKADDELALKRYEAKIFDLEKERHFYVSKFNPLQQKVESWVKTQSGTSFLPGAPAPPTLGELEIMELELQNILKEQNGRSRATFMACYGTDYNTNHEADFERIFANLHKSISYVKDLRAALYPTPHHASTGPPVTITPFKEKVILPFFDGTVTKWPEFRDIFLHKVNVEKITSGASKLAILKIQLTDRAAEVIQGVTLTDANFDSTWARLEERFEDNRELIHAYLEMFCEYPKLTSESGLGLQSLLNLIDNTISSIKNISPTIVISDVLFVHIAVKKLDPKSRAWWAIAPKSDVTTVKELADFLKTRSKALLENPNSSTSHSTPKPAAAGSSGSRTQKSNHASSAKCPVCNRSHPIWSCPDFKALPSQGRWDLVKSKRLCHNCLGPHKAPCPSTYTCRKDGCNKHHHTLLHPDQPPTSTGGATPRPRASNHSRSVRAQPESVAILGTVIVDIKNSRGVKQPCRVFVDDGSEVNFITSDCLRRLGLRPQRTYVPLTVIGNVSGKPARNKIRLILESRSEPYTLDLEALVLTEFTGLIPAVNCKSDWPHFNGITLSDPQFDTAHCCDILLGGKKSGHILLPQVVQDSTNPDAPVAWNTRFGWMVKGEAPPLSTSSRPIRQRSNHVSFNRSASPQEVDLTQFWAQEEPLDSPRNMSLDDMECESHFTSTHARNHDGTYTVELPFKKDPNLLGKSRNMALQRFLKVEERLIRNPTIKTEYAKCIQEFLELGYLEPVPAEEEHDPPARSYYMPHREVVKDSSSSTKVRIVYDASAKTSTGVSLNDVLHVGPKLQADLFPLLIRFMTHRVAISADIWKFYPQTSINPKDRDFHRLVWRDSPTKPIQDFRMTRVTFGVSAAPFLAIRSLHQMADDVEELSPHVVQIIKNDFLVDNLLSGANDVEAALTLQTELLTAMHLGGLRLLKWTSNSPEVLAAVPPELRDPSATLAIDEGDFIKTIGILWNPRADTFSINVNVPPHPPKTTKRTILSTIARTFDPLGWLTPVTLRPKLLLQELWKAKLDWDEPIPTPLFNKWMKYCEEIPALRELSIHRCAFAPPSESSVNWTHQLHGFSDGSDVAHSACVYIRTIDSSGNIASRLLTGKSHVNPVAKVTTPRSELCGAVLLANLMKAVTKSVDIPFTSIHCWTDSNVVLGRLSPAKKLPVFELNRIRKILELYPAHHWHHVKGEENPADAPSRGISASSLLQHPLWLHGPPWLLGHLPDPPPLAAARNVAVTPSPISDMLRNCSSYPKMKRRMAYVLRFVNNARTGKGSRTNGPLSVHELDQALDTIVQVIQQEEFPQELEDCARSIPLKAPFKFLAPFLDESGTLRVGGRLERADIPYRKKHPALLPKDHPFTEAMVRSLHLTHLHPGPTLLLSIIREQFWIKRGRDLVAKIVHACVTCHRFRATKSMQLMGQLPPSRVNPAPVFTQTGMDYAGPFTLALRTGRKPPMTTAYVALFICMATKAIHLELASDLSTATFLAALQRFISRRGAPTDLYSDGGTNFVGARSELAELRGLIESSTHEDAVQQLLTSKGTQFHINPPGAPHHGGLWEAGVKSMKHHLRRVIGSRHLTVEEFQTLLCRVEAILNSRPLTPMSSDPADSSVLTPGHFLIGRPLIALPHPDLTALNEQRLDRWQRVEAMTQHIWKAWSRDYLSQLQARPKWCIPCPDLTTGTLVLIADETAFGPQHWKLGRIVESFPGRDGKARVYDVRTNVTPKKPMGTILRRPITKLSPLPIY